MKFSKYDDIEYTGKYSVIGMVDSCQIVLLEFMNSLKPREGGRRNIMCISAINDEIIWIVEPPKEAQRFGPYYNATLDKDVLKAWYDSFLIEIDIRSGEVLSEQFIK